MTVEAMSGFEKRGTPESRSVRFQISKSAWYD